MAINIVAYRRRTCVHTITVTESDGSNVTFSAGDVFRVKIGRDNETPLLDLDSAAASANGSSLTAANPTTLTLNEDDMTMDAGLYSLEAAIYDISDTAIKHADKGTLTVIETQTGDVGAS